MIRTSLNILFLVVAMATQCQTYTASVSAVEGIAVFYDATPEHPHRVCATVKVAAFTFHSRPAQRVAIFRKRSRKASPEAFAVILDANMERGQVLCPTR